MDRAYCLATLFLFNFLVGGATYYWRARRALASHDQLVGDLTFVSTGLIAIISTMVGITVLEVGKVPPPPEPGWFQFIAYATSFLAHGMAILCARRLSGYRPPSNPTTLFILYSVTFSVGCVIGIYGGQVITLFLLMLIFGVDSNWANPVIAIPLFGAIFAVVMRLLMRFSRRVRERLLS